MKISPAANAWSGRSAVCFGRRPGAAEPPARVFSPQTRMTAPNWALWRSPWTSSAARSWLCNSQVNLHSCTGLHPSSLSLAPSDHDSSRITLSVRQSRIYPLSYDFRSPVCYNKNGLVFFFRLNCRTVGSKVFLWNQTNVLSSVTKNIIKMEQWKSNFWKKKNHQIKSIQVTLPKGILQETLHTLSCCRFINPSFRHLEVKILQDSTSIKHQSCVNLLVMKLENAWDPNTFLILI